jgi:hypothetical protein
MLIFQFSRYTLSQQRFKGIISTIENGVDIPGKSVYTDTSTLIFQMSEESDIDEIVEDDFEEDLDEDISDDIDEE